MPYSQRQQKHQHQKLYMIAYIQGTIKLKGKIMQNKTSTKDKNKIYSTFGIINMSSNTANESRYLTTISLIKQCTLNTIKEAATIVKARP